MVIAGASNKRSLHTKRIVVVKVPQSFVHQCFYALLTQKPETERGVAVWGVFQRARSPVKPGSLQKSSLIISNQCVMKQVLV